MEPKEDRSQPEAASPEGSQAEQPTVPSMPAPARSQEKQSNNVLTGVVGGALVAGSIAMFPPAWILGGIVGGILSSDKIRDKAAKKLREVFADETDRGSL